MGYQAVRTERYKYIHYTELSGMDELYDLRSDPLRDEECHRLAGLAERPAPECSKSYRCCCTRQNNLMGSKRAAREAGMAQA